jgi:hypothetical protein
LKLTDDGLELYRPLASLLLVDALGLVGQLLDQMVPGPKPKEPEKPKPDSGYRPFSLGERPLDWLVF